MGMPLDLELLREVFGDKKTNIAVGKVLKLGLASDRSVLRAECSVLTQDRQVVARVCWDSCGPDSGSFQFPVVGDIVLLEFAEGSDDQVYLTKRISNRTDKIPTQAITGDMVHRSLAGKKLHLLSDTKILLGTGGTEAAQPLVLGTVFKTFMSTVLSALSDQSTALKTLSDELATVTGELETVSTSLASHTHALAGLPGFTGSPDPGSASALSGAASTFGDGTTAMGTAGSAMDTAKGVYDAQKAAPIDNEAVLSDLAFTEKGA